MSNTYFQVRISASQTMASLQKLAEEYSSLFTVSFVASNSDTFKGDFITVPEPCSKICSFRVQFHL